MKKLLLPALFSMSLITFFSCGGGEKSAKSEAKSSVGAFTGAKGEVKIISLDPGHFHAALVQNNMYDEISHEVYVYAPEGSDVKEHLKLIDGYNKRAKNPASWVEKVYTGSDYLEKMLADKKGNVVVLAGNNRLKTDYIKKSVEAGLNVFSDKPMVISPDKFGELEEAFKIAQQKGVLLYDIMTGRFEINSILLKELSQLPEIFGKLQNGTPEHPAIEISYVHHFYKNVSGNTLVRPAWYFDVEQQGEGIVDVTTHMVDFIQWGCFPNQVINKSDIEMISARRWPTLLSKEEFKSVTQVDQYPDYLKKDLKGDKLNVFANGEMTYKIKGVCVKLSVEWRYKAPEGRGDTQYAIIHGTNCNLQIRQGKEENFIPTLYVMANEGTDLGLFAGNLEKAVVQDLPQSGLGLEKISNNSWKIIIPDKYKIAHEDNFSQVMEKYLSYLKEGKLPAWEVPNMIAKYYTTTSALRLAKESK
jgi:predicted dehydrogenase